MNVGDALPPLERTLDLATLVAYAAATWDWYPTHYDPVAVEAAQLEEALVDGQMLGALLAEQALDTFGGAGQVTEMRFRFRSLVFAGETVRCEGEIEAIDGTRVTLRQRVLVGERVALEPATTVVELA